MEKHKCLSTSHKFIQLRLCCLIVFLLFVSKITEAQSVTIGSTGASSYFYGPYYRSTAASVFNYSKYCYLYTASELGIPNGSTITRIEWQKASGTITAPNNFQILLANSSLTNLTSGATWATLSAGASSVYNSTNQAFLSSSGWESFNLNAFSYTGGSLIVLTDHVKSGTASGVNNYYYNAAAGKSLGIASSAVLTSSSALSSATYGGNRPNIKITYTAPTCVIFAPTSVTSATICISGQSATISAIPSSGANTIRWYTSSTGGTFLGTGASYTATYSTGSTRYASGYNTSNGCESSVRTPVTISLTSLSAPSSVTGSSICQSGQSATISATPASGANSARWYSASTGGSVLGIGLSYTSTYSSASIRYVSSYNSTSGCESPSRTLVNVNYYTLINPAIVYDTIICNPGYAMVSAIPSLGANNINWYNASAGGSLLTTSPTYSATNISATTTVYASSYNTTNGCESIGRTPVQITLSPLEIVFTKESTNGNDSNSVIVNVLNGTAPYWYDWSVDGVGDFDDVKNQYDLLPGTYTLEVKDQLNCLTKDSIEIYKEIIIPTGISPDGDGINDTWNITGWEQFSDIEVQVTNILGQVIHFQKGTYIPWDGKLDGKTINKGEYFFHISSSKLKLNKTGMLVVKY
jgi:gliding motility-associated-like protein